MISVRPDYAYAVSLRLDPSSRMTLGLEYISTTRSQEVAHLMSSVKVRLSFKSFESIWQMPAN
jgi:hypothetical protein